MTIRGLGFLPLRAWAMASMWARVAGATLRVQEFPASVAAMAAEPLSRMSRLVGIGLVAEEENNRDPNSNAEFQRLPGPVYALAFSPDGSLVAAAGAADEIHVFKTADCSRPATIRVDEGSDIYALAFSPSGGHPAFAGYSGTVTVAETGTVTATFGAAPLE